jgi:hypothetical protein
MAKFVPYLHALAPSLPLLSPGYSATECVAGLASSLLEASFKQPLGGSPGLPAPGSPSGTEAATGPVESYVLLPHISCFYEFVSQSNGRVYRCAQGSCPTASAALRRWKVPVRARHCARMASCKCTCLCRSCGSVNHPSSHLTFACRLEQVSMGETYELVVSNMQVCLRMAFTCVARNMR